MTKRTVGIFIFDDVEVLDFAGPFEVFSRTRLVPGAQSRRSDESAPFKVFTVAQSATTIPATGGLRVTPDYTWDTAPSIDILVIPGGFGTRPLLEHTETIDWIQRTAERAKHVTSVCTGALLLAKAGLLRGRRATTHWAAHDLLQTLDPSMSVVRDARVVRDTIVSSAGVSAGIDMAFDVVESLCGKAVADETAHYIEYERRTDASRHEARAYMVIERFKDGNAAAVYQRFRERGRLVPDGLTYVSSWVDERLERCYQVMATDDRALIDRWIENWSDLVDFDVVPVMTSSQAAERATKT
jgi:transcriptional regulator GlxA family with amidase domain